MSIIWRPTEPAEQDFFAIEQLPPRSGILLLGPNWGCEISRHFDWKTQVAEKVEDVNVFINRDPDEDFCGPFLSEENKRRWWSIQLQKVSAVGFFFPSYGEGVETTLGHFNNSEDVDEFYQIWVRKELPKNLSLFVGSGSKRFLETRTFGIFCEWLRSVGDLRPPTTEQLSLNEISQLLISS